MLYKQSLFDAQLKAETLPENLCLENNARLNLTVEAVATEATTVTAVTAVTAETAATNKQESMFMYLISS